MAGEYALRLGSGAGWGIALHDGTAQFLGYIGSNIESLSTTDGPLGGNNLTAHPITSWVQGTVRSSTDTPVAGADLRLRNDASTIYSALASATDGSYRIGAFAGSWVVGDSTHNKTSTILEQNVTLAEGLSTEANFVVDVTPPVLAITPVTSTTSDSQTIVGTVEAGATVSVAADTAVTVGPVSASTATSWSCTVSGLAVGSNAISVTATDWAGNSSTTTATIVRRLDPPVADAGGPYTVSLCANDTLTLNGAKSFHPEQGASEYGCTSCVGAKIASWAWDLVAPNSFDVVDASSADPIKTVMVNPSAFFSQGTFPVALKVADNILDAFPHSGNSANLTGTASGTVEVRPGCICDLSAYAKPYKADLIWTPTGAPNYDIYRSSEGPNSGFVLIAKDHVTSYATYANYGLTNGQRYWWRVVSNGGSCSGGSNSATALPHSR